MVCAQIIPATTKEATTKFFARVDEDEALALLSRLADAGALT
jgi:hypothetical protein